MSYTMSLFAVAYQVIRNVSKSYVMSLGRIRCAHQVLVSSYNGLIIAWEQEWSIQDAGVI